MYVTDYIFQSRSKLCQCFSGAISHHFDVFLAASLESFPFRKYVTTNELFRHQKIEFQIYKFKNYNHVLII